MPAEGQPAGEQAAQPHAALPWMEGDRGRCNPGRTGGSTNGDYVRQGMSLVVPLSWSRQELPPRWRRCVCCAHECR